MPRFVRAITQVIQGHAFKLSVKPEMLSTPSIGFDLPPGFNGVKYDAIQKVMASRRTSYLTQWDLFATGWNGVAYRARAANESSERFTRSIEISQSPPPNERFEQETDFFMFFASVTSAIECFHFAIYSIAAIVNPIAFSINKDQELRFYPWHVRDKFATTFPTEAITSQIDTCQRCKEFQDIYTFRDVLSHRGMLPRRFYEGGPQSGQVTTPINPKSLSSSWNYSFEIDKTTTNTYLKWLLSNLSNLFQDTNTFCSKYL